MNWQSVPSATGAPRTGPGFHHIVVMRFSYPAPSGFRMSLEGPERSRAKLYDPERLDRRFHLFERLTLPSLLNQSCQDYDLAVIIGDDLPAKYRSHLEFLLKPLRPARLFPLPPINREVAHVINAIWDKRRAFIASTRLDDDDAISTDCIETISTRCRHILDTGFVAPPVALAFNNGLFLEKSPQGVSLYGVTQKTPLGIGLTLLISGTARQTVYTRNHRHVAAYWNCISDAVNPSFIRTVHVDNDSGAYSDGQRIDYTQAQLHEILGTRFNLDLKTVLSL